jgi:hypothetical protein
MRPTLLSLALIAATTVLGPSLAVAWHAGEVVVDGYRLPKDHRFDSQDEKGKRFTVSINEVPGLLKQNKPILDQTANVWVRSPGGKVNQRYVASGSGPATAAADKDKDKDGKDKWQRIHGQVESVQGSMLRFRADDGRTLDVDMSKVNPEVRRALTQNEKVTVIGFPGAGKNDFRAEYIQQDRGGAGSPAASTKASGSGTPRISGTVGVIGGSTMDMRTNDGRTLVVDLSEVSPDLVKSLNPGDPITVTGKLSGSNLKAQSLQKASR